MYLAPFEAGTTIAASSRMSHPPGEANHARPVLRVVRRPMRIVVAEDDLEMRSMLVQSLRHDGYDVVEAEDGEDLLSYLLLDQGAGTQTLDLIVSDVRMPGVTGIDMLETLRATDDTTPVILMTAFPDDITRARAEKLGAMLFDKPFDVDELRLAVAALLRRTAES